MRRITLRLLLILGVCIAPALTFAQSINTIANHVTPDQVELFQKRLKIRRIFKTVKDITGASKEEMKMFHQFYMDSLASDRSAFVNAVLNRRITNDLDIKAYADKRIPQYISMFRRFQDLRRRAPSTVDEYSFPSSYPLACVAGCNNIDFENGNLSSWTACYAANTSTSSSFLTTPFTCFGPLGAVTVAAFDPATSSNQVSLTSGAGFDPIAGALIPVVAPGGGSYSCEVGDGTGSNYGVAMIEQSWI
ncbi:MAG TPA: hypothetical protein VK808_09985, partial [Bacteroidia bacterium]|nr:hypothetical protein [Bacteroidia bacterium]